MTDTPPKLSIAQMGAGVFVLLAGPTVGSLLGSFTGDSGTVWGAAIGSVVIPAVLAWLFLRATYHARNRLSRVPWRKAKRWHYAAAVLPVAAIVFVVAMGGLQAVEATVLHRSLSAEVTHSKSTGTTFGSVLDSHPVSPSPSPTPQSPSPTGSVTVTAPVPAVSPTASGPVTAAPSLPASPAPATGPTSGMPSMQAPAQSQQGEATP